MSYLSEKYGDTKIPNEQQRQKFCELIYRAFIEMRILGWQGKSEQVADLADAFHNLPQLLYSEDFSVKFFRIFLQSYHEKYPRNETGGDFLQMLDKIIEETK